MTSSSAEHDYAFKKKHAIKFLEEGAKLKAFVFFKGRSIVFKEQGHILGFLNMVSYWLFFLLWMVGF